MLLKDSMFHHFFVSKSDSYLILAFGASSVRSNLVQLLNLLLYLMISLGVIFFFHSQTWSNDFSNTLNGVKTSCLFFVFF